MLRNNFVALLIHIIINTLVFIVYGIPSSNPRYGFFGELSFFLTTLFCYFVIGYFMTGKIFKYFKSKVRNIVSISLIFTLGLLVWAYKFIADIWWVLEYFWYNYYATPLYSIFSCFHYDPFKLVDLEILFSLLPVLLIWAGMELKNIKKTN